MPIVNTDIVKRLSTTAGAAGDTTASTPATSLGKYVATTVITDATLSNLFREITAAEAAAGIVLYRCLFILNNHASLTSGTNTAITVNTQTSGGGSFAIGLDTTAISAKGSSSAQAVTIASETAAPAGASFTAGPLTIGALAPAQVKAVWVQYTVSAGTSAINPDGVVLRVSGDTPA